MPAALGQVQENCHGRTQISSGLEKIVNELKEMEEKLRNPNLESPTLKAKYQEKVKEYKVKQDDMVAYDKRTKATIAQRQEIY